MSLYKRGNTLWSSLWIDGVRSCQSTGTANRRVAEQIEKRFREQLNLKRHQIPNFNPDMTFEELFARFAANGGPKPYHIDRAKLLLPYFADIPIGRINRNAVREYRIYRHREKQVSDATINRDIGCLRNILYWAVDEGLLASNPLTRVPLVRERRKRRSVMDLKQERLLLEAAAPHLRKIILAALYTGMRRGEILKQCWEDVDFARRLLFVSHSKTPEGEAREIPLSDRLFNLLWESRENDGPIFTFKGRPIADIKSAWKAALRRSGICHYRFHDLRHAFASRLMLAGAVQEVRKALMGHSSGEYVHATYVHVELPAKREAIRQLEAWVKNQIEIGSEKEVSQFSNEIVRAGDLEK